MNKRLNLAGEQTLNLKGIIAPAMVQVLGSNGESLAVVEGGDDSEELRAELGENLINLKTSDGKSVVLLTNQETFVRKKHDIT